MILYYTNSGKMKTFNPYPGLNGKVSHASDGRYLAFIPQNAASHIRVCDLQTEKWVGSFFAFGEKLIGDYSLIVEEGKIHVISLTSSPHYKVFSPKGDLLSSKILASLGIELEHGLNASSIPSGLPSKEYKVDKQAAYTFHLDFTFSYSQMDSLWSIIGDKLSPYRINIQTKTPNKRPNTVNRCLVFNKEEVDLNPNVNEGGASVVGAMFEQSEFVQRNCYVELDLNNAVGIHARQILHEWLHNARCGHVNDMNSVMYENTKKGASFWIDPDTDLILKLF